MYDARQDASREAAVSAGNLAASVAHDVDRNIELLDLAIQAVAASWSDPTIHALAPALRNKVLFAHFAAAQDIGSIVLLDPTGVIRATSKEDAPLPTSLADRDFFRVHVGGEDVGLFVSKPFLTASNGIWQVGLSRRITNPDGSFGGVVVGALQMSYLNKLYNGLNLGSDGTITLFRTDGAIITREPYVETDIRRRARYTDSFSRIRSLRSGSIEGASPFDGKHRIISFHRVGNLPLIQDVEVSLDQAYAAWWRKTLTVGGAIGLLCLISLILSLQLQAELARRIEVEATLNRLATTDALTELANRRRFNEALNSEWRRAIRGSSNLSLLMIDADKFKCYNDTCGHPAGDELLKSLAHCIGAQVRRAADLAARYGGEEFAVLLPDTDLSGAKAVAEAIRTAIMALQRPHPGSASRIATVSIGGASLKPTIGQSSDHLVAAADAALYQAKADGRNCSRVEPVLQAEHLIAA